MSLTDGQPVAYPAKVHTLSRRIMMLLLDSCANFGESFQALELARQELLQTRPSIYVDPERPAFDTRRPLM